MSRLKKILNIFLAVLILFTICSSAVLAAETWDYCITITVTDTSGTARTNVQVLTGINTTNLINNGYLSSTALNSNLKDVSGTVVAYSVISNQIAFVIPTLGSKQTLTYFLYLNDLTGGVATQTNFPFIFGTGGYGTIDHTVPELGDDFEVKISGNIDTANGANKNLVYKLDSFRTFVSAAGVITSEIAGAGGGGGSLNVLSGTADGYIYKSDPDYNTAWIAATGTIDDTSTTMFIGQAIPSDYYIYRGYLYFDTSPIPDTATITSATLTFSVANDYTSQDFSFQVTNGQPTFPTSPNLAVGDYDKSNYAGVGGGSSLAGGMHWDISFNATGLGWIDKTGTTKLCIRSSRDITDQYPSSAEYAELYTAESGGGTAPQLAINYTVSGGASASVSTTGLDPAYTVSSASHIIKTTADTTDLKIYVDGTERGTTALGGASVPITANDYKINQNNTLSSVAYYEQTVSSSLVIDYHPNQMINGTTMLNLVSANYNGIITFGANSGLTVVVGGMTPFYNPVPAAPVPNNISPANMPSSWFGIGTNMPNLPFYTTFNDKATEMGMTTQTLYLIMMLTTATCIGLSVLLFTGSAMLTIMAIAMTIGAGVSTTVLSGWMVFFFIIMSFGIYYLSRQG